MTFNFLSLKFGLVLVSYKKYNRMHRDNTDAKIKNKVGEKVDSCMESYFHIVVQ